MRSPMTRTITALIMIVLCNGLGTVHAGDLALMRVDRRSADDRNGLIGDGVSLVAELSDSFLAVGDIAEVTGRAAARGLAADVLHPDAHAGAFALAGVRAGRTPDGLDRCGVVLWTGPDWTLVRTDTTFDSQCSESPQWFFRSLDLEPLAATRAEPAWLTELGQGRATLVPDPMVQEMVDWLTDDVAFAHWQAIIDSATSRYSTSAGCSDAAADAYQLFSDLGLSPEYQYHTGGHAPNVVGTIPGSGGLGDVIVVIGHLDDMPSSGLAPGADDNASGSALVTAVAEAMSCYSFANTVKLILVTGEEFGLYGSSYYSGQAASSGENITAVFNADMVGWQGDGTPAIEDLDINLNTAWPSLGTYLEQVASDYSTGSVINAFTCNSMVYSDHAPFWDDGFPAVCAITDNEGFCGEGGSYPVYHTSNDTIVNCGPGAKAFLGASARTFLAAAAHMAVPTARLSSTPQNPVASAAGDNQVSVSWDPLGGNPVYQVTRITGGCSGGGPEVALGETGDSTWLDTTASGGILYGYTVRARDAGGGCVSDPSTCVEAMTSGPCTEPPMFAGLNEAVNLADATCKVLLGWPAVDQVYCGTSATYSVYRSTTPGFVPDGASRIAAGLTSTSYLDQDSLEYDIPYYYVVRAVDTSNGSEDANTVERSVVPTGPIAVGTWSDDAGDTGSAKLLTSSPWSVQPTGGATGPAVYTTGAYGNNTCAAVNTPPLRLGAGAQLSFASKYAIEDDWDKGVVQISANGGSTWSRLEVGYPGTATNTGDACGLPTGTYFTGNDATYHTYTVSLAAWSGQEVIIRWLLSTDTWVTDAGWWVDDITVTQVEVPGPCTTGENTSIFADSFESGDTSAWSEVVQ